LLLESTDSASHKVADLVRRNRPALDGALQGLNVTLRSLNKRQLELAAGVSYLHDAVRGYQSVGYSQGTPNRWANIFVQSLGPIGMDAAFGPCGALDQALDDLLGPDPRECHERHDYGEPEESEGKRSGGADEAPEEEDPAGDLLDEIVPGDLGDFLDGVTGTAGLGAALRGGLL
jgi:phospholipid/cholesterol/gamma-HCH transport system substrate-binding protein